MIYYTSDLHLGNTNIIKYENRPWGTVEEMDRGLIGNWNQVISHDDEVYVLGDFCFNGANTVINYLENLNGHIHFIRGNHDRFMSQQIFQDYCLGNSRVKNEGWYKHMYDREQELVLCHFPILYWDGMDDGGAVHLYGHMHSRPNMQHPHSDAFNVGVDVNNYRPVTLEQLLAKRDIMNA